jgi:putative aminopeptidase FrvX
MSVEGEGIEDLLRELTALAGPTGQEAEVTGWLAAEWAGRGEVTRSPVGNVALRIPGSGPRLLITAHADELSMIVRGITPEGFLRVLPGERDQFMAPYFPGVPLRILADDGPVPGFLATTTGHAMTTEQRERTRWTWDDVYVDTGLSLEEAAEAGIRIGTRMVWDVPLRRMGRLVVGKSLDDRLGIAVMVELARRLEPGALRYDVTFAATVQEEIGMLGAASLSRGGAEFEIGIVIDNGLAGDIPTVSPQHVPVRLGAGPALVHRDSAAHYSPRLIEMLRASAGRAGVGVQDMILFSYASDGVNLVRQGMETVLIAPPIRYSHSPFEAADPADIEATVRLLEDFLTSPPPGHG